MTFPWRLESTRTRAREKKRTRKSGPYSCLRIKQDIGQVNKNKKNKNSLPSAPRPKHVFPVDIFSSPYSSPYSSILFPTWEKLRMQMSGPYLSMSFMHAPFSSVEMDFWFVPTHGWLSLWAMLCEFCQRAHTFLQSFFFPLFAFLLLSFFRQSTT